MLADSPPFAFLAASVRVISVASLTFKLLTVINYYAICLFGGLRVGYSATVAWN